MSFPGDDGEFLYQFGTTNKIKRPANAPPTPNDCDYDKSNRSSKSTYSSAESPVNDGQDVHFPGDDKSSYVSIGLGCQVPCVFNILWLMHMHTARNDKLVFLGSQIVNHMFCVAF